MTGKERMTLAMRRRRVGDRLFIKGNLDSVNTLRTGMRAPGYILSTACSVAPAVPEEHVRILAEVAEQVGRYE